MFGFLRNLKKALLVSFEDAHAHVEAFRSGESYYHKDWRTSESELTRNSYPVESSWRMPAWVRSHKEYVLMNEIDHRRKNGKPLTGLQWESSEDPYHPANNKNHPYYIGQ